MRWIHYHLDLINRFFNQEPTCTAEKCELFLLFMSFVTFTVTILAISY